MKRTFLAVALVLVGCGARSATTPAPVGAAPIANRADAVTLPLPEEPWYRDKPERRDDCVSELKDAPAEHFPAPFERCDPHAESFSSPPGGGELHFHYRYFSAELTRTRRTGAPRTCCYMVWEFPRR